MVKFSSYEHFKNYCFKVAYNKDIKLSKRNYLAFDKFEKVISLLTNLKKSNRIVFDGDPLERIVNLYKKEEIEEATATMDYLSRRIAAFENGEIDIYYVFTSFDRMLNIKITFIEEFINEESIGDPYFPSKLRVYEVITETERIHSINTTGIDMSNVFGIYFIYDNKGEIAYIGKSTSCAIIRSFTSAGERKLVDFSKIEIRGTKTKSDVAVYEAYYISKYKPYCNSDMVFEDEISLELPELRIVKEFTRDFSSDYYEYTYSFIMSRVCKVRENLTKIGKSLFLETEENKRRLEDKGLFDKYTMKTQAYEECLNELKQKGDVAVSEIKWHTK